MNSVFGCIPLIQLKALLKMKMEESVPVSGCFDTLQMGKDKLI